MRRPAFTILAIWSITGWAQPMTMAQQNSGTIEGLGSRGKLLFTGVTRLHNGGPACISCHSIAGLSFPNGGTLGPDLTRAYEKLGPRGTQSAMQTLYFRVMTPIYSAHPLDPGEQADLITFLQQAQAKSESQWNTQILLLASLLLSGILVALTGFLWRDRVKSVRQTLVDKASRQGARV
jgi:hypothetical protein